MICQLGLACGSGEPRAVEPQLAGAIGTSSRSMQWWYTVYRTVRIPSLSPQTMFTNRGGGGVRVKDQEQL